MASFGNLAKRKHSFKTPIGLLATLVLASALAVPVAPSAGAETVLKGGFFLGAKKSLYYRPWQSFVDKVNTEGKGLVQIPTTAGPETFSRRQWCNALKNGIIDIVGLAQSWCNNLVPGSEALNAATRNLAEQRKVGAYDYIRDLFAQRANAYFYAQYGWGAHHYFFSNKPIRKIADFKDQRLYRSGTIKVLLAKLGVQGVSRRPGQIYTAVERGVIDGFAMPLSAVAPFGLHKVVKYRIDPGIYNPAVMLLINLDTWKKLDSRQKAFMEKVALHLEGELDRGFADKTKAMGERLVTKQGITLLKFDPSEAAKFSKLANDAVWEGAIKAAPKTAPRLRQLLMK